MRSQIENAISKYHTNIAVWNQLRMKIYNRKRLKTEIYEMKLHILPINVVRYGVAIFVFENQVRPKVDCYFSAKCELNVLDI